MKLLKETIWNEDASGKKTNTETYFVFIEDKSETKVLKLIDLLENEGWECHNCPTDDVEYGGMYSDSFTIWKNDFITFKEDYNRLKKLV